MSSMLSQIIIILLLVVVILVALKIFGIITPGSNSGKKGKDTIKPDNLNDDNATKRAPEWKVELIDNESGSIIKEKNIPGLSGNEVFTIGRENCDFNIPSDYVSRKNAKIMADGNRYIFLVNKNSAEVYHNGKKCDQIAIRDGLVLKMAKVVPIRFVEISAEDLFKDVLGGDTHGDESGQADTIEREVINPRF